MSATVDNAVADLQRSNAELQRRLDEALAERDEALEQQTATAEVLGVINSSPGDLAPVFDTMLEKALRLCSAALGYLYTCDGERFLPVAAHGDPGFSEWLFRRGAVSTVPGSPLDRITRGESFVQITDATEAETYRMDSGSGNRTEVSDTRTQLAVAQTGARTAIWVALRKDAAPLGAFVIYRQEVRPFSDKQIALLENFAAQAVIAMENARLITETREALEQQTATAEVLGVINSSPGDLAPVFDAMLDKALQLCGAGFGLLHTFDGKNIRNAAHRGVSPAFAKFLAGQPPAQPAPSGLFARFVHGDRFVHLDAAESEAYRAGVPIARALVEVEGGRSLIAVPLRKDAALLGAIVIYKRELRPFTDKQIALLQNFAAQAVIAMENARLITETREALEQQTATAEVLQVINSSPGDLAPVFDVILEKALRLCEAACGHILTYDGELLHLVAVQGEPRFIEWTRQRGPRRLSSGITFERIVGGDRHVHIADCRDTDAYRDNPKTREAVEISGVRTLLTISLRKDGALLGTISVYRQEARPFSDKQITLLQNFAEQAVIAIENARLINETREALEQQTATSEVLQVINGSPGDLGPVFDAILERAHSLCGSTHGALATYDGKSFRAGATHGLPDRFVELVSAPYPPSPGSLEERLVLGEAFVHIPDVATLETLPDNPISRAAVEFTAVRTVLLLPLRKDGVLLGYISAHRRDVRPFSEKEIALLQNFAAQAVIAMESARLITETREALDQQTATAEVLGVINSSPGNLAPVFDAILEKAHSLCGVEYGTLRIYDGEKFSVGATRGYPDGVREVLRRPYAPEPNSPFRALFDGAPLVEIPDITEHRARGPNPRADAAIAIGIRSVLLLPLRKDNLLLGLISAARKETSRFTEKQIALLQNFAAQAVIAMENARLINETREALEQQQAIAEVLQVINSSPGNLKPIFDILLDKAMQLCGAAFGMMVVTDDDQFHTVAARGLPPAFADFLEHNPVRRRAGSMATRIQGGESFVHILDLKKDALYRRGYPHRRALVDLGGARTSLAVALPSDRAVLGAIYIYRTEVRAFSDKQITLLQNFAAQAVIAMENARLLNEIRQRQAELRVTFDNMADGVAMFDEDLRLAAWNRNFQEIADLPEALLAERPSYADYLRILTERGELDTLSIDAEISRRLEETDQELRLERTRPDGRVIEVRRNSVPDGGFVLIYSDITERKRSEAEIRAARDTAEATLRDLRAAQANLIQAEKMASLGQLTAGIAHEIKNPLNFVNNFADLSGELLKELQESAAPGWAALDEDKRAEIDETIAMLTGNLEKIGEHGRRADGIVKSMLEHSRGVTSERRVVDLNNLIEEALNLAYHGARAQDQSFNIRMDRDFDRDLARIELVPQEMSRVFINLFVNGFYAATKRQRDSDEVEFQPTLMVATRDLGDAVEVRVRDNGIGIPAEIRDKLFQPFFTTKPTGEGTGLGLSISYDIVTQQHGGTIEVESRPGEFTEFTVRLPRSYRAAEAAS